jgi:hypothetical protein
MASASRAGGVSSVLGPVGATPTLGERLSVAALAEAVLRQRNGSPQFTFRLRFTQAAPVSLLREEILEYLNQYLGDLETRLADLQRAVLTVTHEEI